MPKENETVCFSFVIQFRGEHDEGAWERILDAFIVAVERENAGAGGGMHLTGTNRFCTDCEDFDDDDTDTQETG